MSDVITKSGERNVKFQRVSELKPLQITTTPYKDRLFNVIYN